MALPVGRIVVSIAVIAGCGQGNPQHSPDATVADASPRDAAVPDAAAPDAAPPDAAIDAAVPDAAAPDAAIDAAAPDAAAPDASIDAGVPDASPPDAAIDADPGGVATVVTQTALAGGTIGARAGDIEIVSNLPDLSVLADTRTDANGDGTIRVSPGGSVTAIYQHNADGGADLITWLGVKPGDTLTFGNQQPVFSGPGVLLGEQTYTWPPVPGADTYIINTSCGGVSVPPNITAISISEVNSCHHEPMDVLFRATMNSTNLLGFGFLSNVAFRAGQTVALDAWTTEVPTATVRFGGLHPEISSVSGEFATVIDDSNLFPFNSYSFTWRGSGTAETFPWHPTGDRTVGAVFFERDGFSLMTLRDSLPADALVQNVGSPDLPPWVQGSVNVSAALHTATWFLFQDGPPVYYAQVLHLTWNHEILVTSHPFQWHVILPPGLMSVTLPTLPLPHRGIPLPEDPLRAQITVFQIPSVTSDDMLRTIPSASIMCLDCAVRAGTFSRVVTTGN